MAPRKNVSVPARLWPSEDIAAPGLGDVLNQVAHFFDRLGYTHTFTALLQEARENGITVDVAEWERGIAQEHSAPLLELWEEWYRQNEGFPMLPASSSPKKIKAKVADSSDEESSDSESEGERDDEAESTSDDSSEASDSSDEEQPVGQKRKRVLTPSSSSEQSLGDDSSSDASSSDESDARPAKRVRTANSSDSSDDSSIGESSDASSSREDLSGSSAASSDSDSDSGSDSDESSSESDSDSESSSESESDSSDSSASPPPNKKAKKPMIQPSLAQADSSASSATLDHEADPPATLKPSKKPRGKPKPADQDLLIAADTPEVTNDDSNTGMHPDRLKRMPATKENVNKLKKENVPFSRIPASTKVDPRFASNDYVPYDYANRAYQDLSVTRGKGFTKEKNKKKRGTY